jgi:hypothetical protein
VFRPGAFWRSAVLGVSEWGGPPEIRKQHINWMKLRDIILFGPERLRSQAEAYCGMAQAGHVARPIKYALASWGPVECAPARRLLESRRCLWARDDAVASGIESIATSPAADRCRDFDWLSAEPRPRSVRGLMSKSLSWPWPLTLQVGSAGGAGRSTNRNAGADRSLVAPYSVGTGVHEVTLTRIDRALRRVPQGAGSQAVTPLLAW